MSSLSEALTVHAVAPGEWRAFADPRYEAGTGMFGGFTAALLLRAAVADERCSGAPSALTLHYLKRVVPGSELQLRTQLLGGSRSLQYWQVELRLAGDPEPAALATLMVSVPRPSDGFTELSVPDAPEPEALPIFYPPGTFGQRTPVRQVLPAGLFDQPSSRSLHWARELSGRAIDHAQLAYLSDTFAPRIYFKSKMLRPSSTTTMSIYFFATAEQLATLGDDYVLIDAVGTRAEQSTIGSQARLWSRSGALLATTEQLCRFK
jgi:acyl-CoA thioesterase